MAESMGSQFFELPKEEKQKYAREPNGHEGYGNDVIFTENQRNFKVWPQKPDDVRYYIIEGLQDNQWFKVPIVPDALVINVGDQIEKEIKPVDKLVSESRPKLHRPIKSYVEIYFQYYQQGKRAIEASKI
ncbi:2OG-Fe(II) oxygenase family oxidoreductase [Medicago truncatula]|uniref:2OG-Fe(II) oxygenase family oxidoreductase n=1 Tax=Medicago truncatula TaxID=3880 RepID=G7J7S6_MEDTR|nr:2OG-Fe(II) oxygenase family oxidoreductase [Medicago truncatula]